MRPTFRAQTVRNACVPTTIAMLCAESPETVRAHAERAGVWKADKGQDHRTIAYTAAHFGIHLGEWSTTLPTEPGTYLCGVDAGHLYRTGVRSPHCVAVVVRGDGKADLFDGRMPGPVVKQAATINAATLLAARVED